MVGLAEDADIRVSAFSKGMQIRLGFVRALLHRPDLLFLDEPTAGLDPANAHGIRNIVRDLAREGHTIFLTTHDMTLADQLCDRVAFIVDGRISLGVGFNLPLVVLGVSLTSMLMLLVGFISVSPFSSISEYLIPSALYMVPLNLPLLHYLGLEGPILYLVPTQGSLLLLQAAFAPIEVWQLIYAVLYQLVWIGLLAWLARRAFDRWVVARGGER